MASRRWTLLLCVGSFCLGLLFTNSSTETCRISNSVKEANNKKRTLRLKPDKSRASLPRTKLPSKVPTQPFSCQIEISLKSVKKPALYCMSPQRIASLVEATKLIKSHCDQGHLTAARKAFDELSHRDVIAWTAMISGYASNARHADAWATFRDMAFGTTVPPNAFTLSSALKACEGLDWRAGGAAVHALAVRRGLDRQPYVLNSLLHVYSSCGGNGMGDAHAVFDGMPERTAVSWTTIIAGYTHRGDGRTAVQMFSQMMKDGHELSPFTSSIVIRACASTGNLVLGKQIHTAVVKSGSDASFPVANSLIDMYCRCMSLLEAKKLFREMPRRDVVTWNAMIAGLERSLPHETFQLFVDMGTQDIQPNCFTFTSIVSACTTLAVLNCGQQVHGAIIQRGFMRNLEVANALIDMYAKCGCIADSQRIFGEMQQKNLVSWTSMMIGYGINGYGREAVELFDVMICSDIKPDLVVFMGVLSACSHAGLIEQGMKYFNLMRNKYKLVPDKEVYGCVIDLLGRSGRVIEAYELIQTMPCEPDESIWGALLGACKMHNNTDLGRLAAHKILDMKPNGAKTCVLLSNIFAASSEWGEFARTRRLLKGMGSKKEAGRSWIEVRDKVCSFAIGDRSNPQDSLIYGVLGLLAQHMDESKYLCHPNEFLHDMEG